MTPRPAAAIVGIGRTAFSSRSGRSEHELALEAVLAAVSDAGVPPRAIDGIVRYTNDSTPASLLVDSMGLTLDYYGEVGYGGTACCAVVAHAAMAVATGMANYVVVFRAMNGRSGKRFGRGELTVTDHGDFGSTASEEDIGGVLGAPYGLLAPGHLMAMWARRYMHEFAISASEMAEVLAAVAVTQRDFAQRNPHAVTYGRPLDRSTYLESRMIADPLRLYDFCLETDGAVAMVITSADRAVEGRATPVSVLAASQHMSSHSQPTLLYANNTIGVAPQRVGDELFGRAGVTREDIDVAAIYDATSIMVVLTLEALGFCERGRAGAFLLEGENRLGGRMPINTHGGLLSEGYVHGLNSVVEAVMQLRGTAANQVPDAELAFATARGASSLILARGML